MKFIAIGTTFFAWLLFLVLPLQSGSAVFLDQDCGLRAGAIRIVNGTIAAMTSSPWMAFIHSDDGRYICDGSLISHRMVLTAAHCFLANTTLIVRLGEYERTRISRCYTTVANTQYCTNRLESPVDLAIKHHFYDPKTELNDIAILRLAKYVEFKDNIRPICIELNTTLRSYVAGLNPLTATGWGKTEKNNTSDYLRTLEIHRQPRELCDRMISTVLGNKQFCAGNVDSNLCFGDSGGPVGKLLPTLDCTKRFIQVGIASFTNQKCIRASAFTEVMSYVDWIARIVRVHGHTYNKPIRVRAPTRNNPDAYETIYRNVWRTFS